VNPISRSQKETKREQRFSRSYGECVNPIFRSQKRENVNRDSRVNSISRGQGREIVNRDILGILGCVNKDCRVNIEVIYPVRESHFPWFPWATLGCVDKDSRVDIQ